MKRRLARHGFTRPFQLNEDPKQQDQLSTWIEYLYFEYWWLDWYTDTIDRLKPDDDKAWQKLVDSKVLRLNETRESIGTFQSSIQAQSEQDHAWNSLQMAQSKAEQVYASTQLDPRRLSIHTSKRISMLRTARLELRIAKRYHELVEKRNDLISAYLRGRWGLGGAEKDAARHCILLLWILEQVHLIEAELSQIKPTVDRRNGIKRTKRGLDSDDDSSQKGPKRRKLAKEQQVLVADYEWSLPHNEARCL
jgi:hypothetical protein